LVFGQKVPKNTMVENGLIDLSSWCNQTIHCHPHNAPNIPYQQQQWHNKHSSSIAVNGQKSASGRHNHPSAMIPTTVDWEHQMNHQQAILANNEWGSGIVIFYAAGRAQFQLLRQTCLAKVTLLQFNPMVIKQHYHKEVLKKWIKDNC
jgi:hypothetical protein